MKKYIFCEGGGLWVDTLIFRVYRHIYQCPSSVFPIMPPSILRIGHSPCPKHSYPSPSPQLLLPLSGHQRTMKPMHKPHSFVSLSWCLIHCSTLLCFQSSHGDIQLYAHQFGCVVSFGALGVVLSFSSTHHKAYLFMLLGGPLDLRFHMWSHEHRPTLSQPPCQPLQTFF